MMTDMLLFLLNKETPQKRFQGLLHGITVKQVHHMRNRSRRELETGVKLSLQGIYSSSRYTCVRHSPHYHPKRAYN